MKKLEVTIQLEETSEEIKAGLSASESEDGAHFTLYVPDSVDRQGDNEVWKLMGELLERVYPALGKFINKAYGIEEEEKEKAESQD